MVKPKPKTSKEAKAVPVAQSSSDEDDSVPITVSRNGEGFPCGFCGFKYFGEKLVLEGEWISWENVKRGFMKFVQVFRAQNSLSVKSLCKIASKGSDSDILCSDQNSPDSFCFRIYGSLYVFKLFYTKHSAL
jgi:hypothetical protein